MLEKAFLSLDPSINIMTFNGGRNDCHRFDDASLTARSFFQSIDHHGAYFCSFRSSSDRLGHCFDRSLRPCSCLWKDCWYVGF